MFTSERDVAVAVMAACRGGGVQIDDLTYFVSSVRIGNYGLHTFRIVMNSETKTIFFINVQCPHKANIGLMDMSVNALTNVEKDRLKRVTFMTKKSMPRNACLLENEFVSLNV